MLKRAIVAKCTCVDLLEDKVQAVQDVIKLTPDSCATLAEMLTDLRDDINLSEGDAIIMLRRLNTRMDWNLLDSDIMCMFGLQIQTQTPE